MMNEEQAHKAGVALLDQAAEHLKKKDALERHRTAREWLARYGLPYRVSMDYLKHYRADSGLVMVNDCYPLPGYPIDGILTVTAADLRVDDPALYEETGDGGRLYNMHIFDALKEDAAARVESHNRQFRPWDLHTAAGVEAWEREFLHFLDGYDIGSFTAFDMFGIADATQDRLQARVEHYTELQRKYRANKACYRTSEPPYLPEYAEQYTAKSFRLILV